MGLFDPSNTDRVEYGRISGRRAFYKSYRHGEEMYREWVMRAVRNRYPVLE